MAKTKRSGKSKKVDVGNVIDLFSGHSKTSANTVDDEGLVPNFLLTEEEKYADDKRMIKRIFKYNESLCLGQLHRKKKHYEDNYKLARGIINKSDYFLEDELKQDFELLDKEPPSGIDLEFFPIIPNIVNALKQEKRKKYVNFHPKLVDSESINEAIYSLNSRIKEELMDTFHKRFMEEEGDNAPQDPKQKEAFEQELEQKFQSLPHVQAAFQSNYKPEMVEWAEHLIERNNLKFNMEHLSSEIFEDHLLINERYLHVNHLNNDYSPEWISPDKVGFIKSPNVTCTSKGTCVYFLEHLTVQGLISKYGYLMSAEDIEMFSMSMGPGYNTGGFMIDDPWKTPHRTDTVSMNNYNKIMSLVDGEYLDPNTVEIAHQYFIVPRKLGKVTIKTLNRALNSETGEEVTTTNIEIIEVDDTFVKDKEIINTYEEKKEKTADSLIEGVHVDWYYINEAWRGVRCRINSVPHGPVIDLMKKDSEDEFHDIWIKMEKLEYQGRPEDEKWETILPVFGGPVEYKKPTLSKSLVDMLAPFQKYYNYLMNKIKELVITELMPFYVLNKEMLGANSLEESWQDDPYYKFIISGQENGITIADLEGANPQLLAAMPQQTVINLDRSNAIKTRWELAQLFKNEAFSVVGITPQFLGDVGQYETASGVNAGIQQSTLQLQHLFDDHFELMKNVHQYMIDLGQVIYYKKGGLVEMSYINTDTQNVIFKMEADKLPLSKKVGLFVVNSIRENELLFTMRQLALQDNTMGADGYEKALILTANSQAQLLDRLRKQQMKRDNLQEQQMNQQQQMLEQELNAAREELKAKQDFEAKENQLDRELEYITTQIQTLGWSKDVDANDNNVLDVTEVAKLDITNQKMLNDMEMNKMKLEDARFKSKEDIDLKRKQLESQRQANLLQYQTKLEEIRNKRYMKDLDFKIAKENKNKHDK
jgi:hypothetical protein